MPKPCRQTFGGADFGPQGVVPDLIPTALFQRKPFPASGLLPDPN
jgi:hypothetical protein